KLAVAATLLKALLKVLLGTRPYRTENAAPSGAPRIVLVANGGSPATGVLIIGLYDMKSDGSCALVVPAITLRSTTASERVLMNIDPSGCVRRPLVAILAPAVAFGDLSYTAGCSALVALNAHGPSVRHVPEERPAPRSGCRTASRGERRRTCARVLSAERAGRESTG